VGITVIDVNFDSEIVRGAARRRLLLATLLACIASLACCAAAQAGGWLSPVTIGPSSQGLSSVAAGSDADGDVVAAWVRNTGSAQVVEVATRPAGGAFSVQPLQSAVGFAGNVGVAVNDNGDAIAAWVRQGATSEVWASVRPAGGSFGPPQAIASVPGKNALEPSVAINDAGAMIVVWYLRNSDTDGKETVYAAFRPPGGSFTSAPVSSSDLWNQSPRAALDSTGKATIVWSYWNGEINIARVRIRNADGLMGTQRDLSPSAPTGFPMFATVGLDQAGNALAVWSHWNGAVYEVEGATRAAAADTWSNLPTFGQSASASFGTEPQVAVDANGNAVSIWRAANNTIQAASRASGGAFGAAQLGISAPTATAPRVVLDSAGNAVSVWRRSDGEGSRIEAAIRPLGGQFGAVKTLSTQFSTFDPALSMDGLGNALSVWPLDDPKLPDDADMVIQFAAFDNSAPDLTSVSVPASGIAGTGSSFSASARDVWSPVSVSWSFGDGSSGDGESVSHAYAAPGSYTVTVKALDAAGNERTTTRTIQIANPASSPPALSRAKVKLSFKSKAIGRFTKLSKLQLQKVPAGSSVVATCKVGAKKCAGKAGKKFTKKKASGTVSLDAYLNQKLLPGTKIAITVTNAGFIGELVTLTVRKGKVPSLTTKCLQSGTGKPAACA
jgi:PKD domain